MVRFPWVNRIGAFHRLGRNMIITADQIDQILEYRKPWVRHVVTPVRSVINNAHDLGHCAPIRIKGYSKEERVAQDLRRGRKSRVKKTPGSWEWLLKFRQHAPRRQLLRSGNERAAGHRREGCG